MSIIRIGTTGLALVLAAGWAAPMAASAQGAGRALSVAAIQTAVSDAGRPDAAMRLDESRKPAQILGFLGLKRGMAAADLITGQGYWAEILARAVGPKGSVEAFQPVQFYNDPAGLFAIAGLQARNPTIRLTRYPFEALAGGEGRFDFAIINNSYHDLYWQSERFKIPRSDPRAFARAVFAMMKPGAILGVIDHVGLPGDTRAIVDKLHRIDPATVKADFEAAGFKLAGTSDLLANPADDHTKLVYAFGAKTDRFVMKFVKPR